MARMEDRAFAVTEWTVVAAATNAIATATRAAESGKRHYITGISYSTRGGTPAVGTVQVRENAATVLDQFEQPAAQISPVIYNFQRPLRIGTGLSADITVGALGVGIVAAVVLKGFTKAG